MRTSTFTIKYKALAGIAAMLGMVLCLSLGTAVVSVLPSVELGVAYAQKAKNQKDDAPQKSTRRVQTMSEKVYKKLTEAQKLIEENKQNEAHEILNSLKTDTSLNPYEKAQSLVIQGYAYVSKENYVEGMKHFNMALEQKPIPESLELNALYTMAQIYMMMEKYPDVLKTLDKWFALSPSPSPSAYDLKVQAYYQMGDYKSAIANGKTAISLVEEQGGIPKEQLYQIMRAAYFELNDYNNMGKMLELLVIHYPKGDYFSQLSALYSEKNDEEKQVGILEIGFDAGYITKENDIVVLASLLVQRGNPYKAGKILTKAMKDGVVKEDVDKLKLLANAWIFASEAKKSVEVLHKAAKLSEEGELFIQLGASYYDLDQWKEAADAVRAGIKKGKLKREDQAYTTLGQVLFQMNDFEEAIAAFKKARKDERSRELADRWIAYLEKERIRQQQLANT